MCQCVNVLEQSSRSPQLEAATQLQWLQCNPLRQLQPSKLRPAKSACLCHWLAEVVCVGLWQHYGDDSYTDCCGYQNAFCYQRRKSGSRSLAQKSRERWIVAVVASPRFSQDQLYIQPWLCKEMLAGSSSQLCRGSQLRHQLDQFLKHFGKYEWIQGPV